ncbi:glutamate receptor ionotropic, kainate 2 isoform X5 [Coccinella septempunctata]|uniref:glutamate receptor ionotropic, kainate 2 isoform X5 n=1 Tax=Coccinella septempunctata TaxID=41139 RepID=UPI001D05DA67|nr:glutamate receptor ionotropic, kainate 2 isoform X5 [Coccinella septempunctata]
MNSSVIWILVTIGFTTSIVLSLPPVVKIGAIFTEDQENSAVELAFKYAVYKINKDKKLLPRTSLVYDIQYVPRDDSFHASKRACKLVNFGVQAMFGPSDPVLGAHIHSICDALDIPHLEARPDLESEFREFAINLYPAQHLLNAAFQDVMAFLNWTRVAIVYEGDYGIIKLRELIRATNTDLEVHLRQTDLDSYRAVLKEIKTKEIHNVVIDTKPENMPHFLKGILQLQMNDYKYHYLFTTFDLEAFDLEDFKYNFVNMTAFRVVDTQDLSVRELLRDMAAFRSGRPDLLPVLNSSYIQAEAALMYDSVYVFALGLQTLEQSHSLAYPNVSCDREQPWDGGLSLINYINMVGLKGLSGPIEFKEGRRIQFKLDLLKLKQHSLVKVGEWRPGFGVNVTDRGAFFEAGTTNVTLVVTTILEQPYVMMRTDPSLIGNDQFEGFCIDLLREIASMVGFEYRIELVPDGKYGVIDLDTGEWNGIVKQLMEKKADLAVGSMTINYARESVIDFTKPFMNLGISILFKVSTDKEYNLFRFLEPLDCTIWISVGGAFFMSGFCLHTLAKFTPYEWINPRPWEGDRLVNILTAENSFWFVAGTFLRQSSGIALQATSTRIVGGIWWFFTLIIISSYTANLAAFLTVERMITPIENAEDLAGQTEIPYGTLESGSTMTFFRDSMIETYRKMWRFMENRKPSVFVSTYEDGIQRVLKGNYAFLMESTMLDYVVQRDCNLTQIGGLLDSKGYGIATPMGSPWRDKISLAILELQEKGEIQMLYDKWWKNTGDTCQRNDKGKESKANSLGVDNIGGVFVVLMCGLAFAVMVAICEFCYNSKKNSIREKRMTNQQSLCSEMGGELCFAMQCRGSRQRPALRRECSKCLNKVAYVKDDNKQTSLSPVLPISP